MGLKSYLLVGDAAVVADVADGHVGDKAAQRGGGGSDAWQTQRDGGRGVTEMRAERGTGIREGGEDGTEGRTEV